MAEPVQDKQTVTPSGESLQPLPAGVMFHDIATQVDERGTVMEGFDPRWGWHPDPLVYAYTFTIRPGFVKGWGMHKQHEDRYMLLFGEMEVVMFDARPESPTHGLVTKIVLSQHRRQLMNIPAGIWHADRNLGSGEVVVINFPTIAYDHASPDKYRLPLNTDEIPYHFDNPRGW